jgi:hypothetical protein
MQVVISLQVVVVVVDSVVVEQEIHLDLTE